METFETGRSASGCRRTWTWPSSTGDRRIRFLISTEKSGPVVLLHIEEIDPTDATRA